MLASGVELEPQAGIARWADADARLDAGSERTQRLIFSRSEQSLPRTARVREPEDEKRLSVRRDKVLAAFSGAARSTASEQPAARSATRAAGR